MFARDGWRLRSTDRAGGPQDPDKVSARWRTLRTRLGLPEKFRLHDSRASKINNDLDAGGNPVEVAGNARHHNPGYTMRAYGRRWVSLPPSATCLFPAVPGCYWS